MELTTLCGTDVAILVTDLKGHFHCFRSTPELDFVVSEQKLNERLLKADKRLFRYSKEDYPFRKVHLMLGRGSMAVEELTKSSERMSDMVESVGSQLLSKRAMSNTDSQTDSKEPFSPLIEPISSPKQKNTKNCLDLDNSNPRPSKQLKINRRDPKKSPSIKLSPNTIPENPKIKNHKNKTTLKARLWFQHDYPPDIYLFEEYHKVNLKKAILRLESKTHKYHHFFRAQRVGFLPKLKEFHKAINVYFNLHCDEHMIDMFIYRLITSLYFSELDCAISKRLREIPLAQFNSFISLIQLKKTHSVKIFIQEYRRFLNVILSVISMKIPTGRYFSFKRHLKTFKEPLKTKAFYKILLKKYSMYKAANFIKTHYKHYGIDESIHQQTDVNTESQESAPKRFRFRISDMKISDPAMVALMPRIPEVMAFMSLFEDLIYNVLNEVKFYGDAVIFEKRCLKALGKELFYKLDQSEEVVMRFSIEDSEKVDKSEVFGGEGLFGVPGEGLIDLRSRMAGSIGLGSTAKFSWEAL